MHHGSNCWTLRPAHTVLRLSMDGPNAEWDSISRGNVNSPNCRRFEFAQLVRLQMV